ncbi:MAG TPA: ABC transporter permease [Gemmatimonadaceae bacterium]|nr:ABC transporter permease [Gemmatimonadaceae bacterium]
MNSSREPGAGGSRKPGAGSVRDQPFVARFARLLPDDFFNEFGDEIVEHIAADHAAARARGTLALAWFNIATAADLLWSALAERMRPTLLISHASPSFAQEDPMAATLHEWSMDLKLSLRALRRSRGFTSIAVGTLALAIGACAAMFGVVDAVLLKPLPFANQDRLIFIGSSAPGADMPEQFGVSTEMRVHWAERSKLIENISTVNSFTATLRTNDRVERIRMSMPTNSMFAVLGARPILGRLPTDADGENSAVISYKLWNDWFGKDPKVVGRSYPMANDATGKRTIVGVMGPDFKFPSDETLLWIGVPVRADSIVAGRFGPPLIARMRPGVTTDQVQREFTALAKELPERYGGSVNYRKIIDHYQAVVRPLDEQLLGAVARPLWVLLGAVGIVLIIACANVANLFTVRTEGRQRELGVRRAVGASRGQLIRLQLSEAFIVAGLAAVGAILLAWVGLPVFVRAAPADMPRVGEIALDARTLIFAIGAAILAALACGLIPAIRASNPDISRLRESGRGTTRRRHWGRDSLVVAQTALALVLLIGSGLLIRSFEKLSSVDPGYTTKDIFTFQIAPEGPALNTGRDYANFHLNFMERLRALPGVQMVGLVENIPLNEGTADRQFRSEETAGDPNVGPRLNWTFAAGDYFKAMEIRTLAGQTFDPLDVNATLGKVVISRTAAKLLWPTGDPLGHRLQMFGDSSWYQVIGVVNDVMQNDFRQKPDPLIYFPLVSQSELWAVTSPAYVVKSTRAEVIAAEVRTLVKEVAPEAPMYRVFTLAGLARDSMVRLSFTMLTLGIVSALALILGAVGLYGVLSYIVAERTREIGVRMALGAEAGQVRRMVVAQGSKVVAVGVVIGVAVSLASTRALGTLLFNVPAIDIMTFVAMSMAMVGVGLLASYVPARRASAVDPMESLRSD